MLKKCLESLCAGRQIYVNIFVASWHGFMYNSLQFYFIWVTLVIVLLVGRFLYASDTVSIFLTWRILFMERKWNGAKVTVKTVT